MPPNLWIVKVTEMANNSHNYLENAWGMLSIRYFTTFFSIFHIKPATS